MEDGTIKMAQPYLAKRTWKWAIVVYYASADVVDKNINHDV